LAYLNQVAKNNAKIKNRSKGPPKQKP